MPWQLLHAYHLLAAGNLAGLFIGYFVYMYKASCTEKELCSREDKNGKQMQGTLSVAVSRECALSKPFDCLRLSVLSETNSL